MKKLKKVKKMRGSIHIFWKVEYDDGFRFHEKKFYRDEGDFVVFIPKKKNMRALIDININW